MLSSRFNTLRVPDTASERDATSLENLALTAALGDKVARWSAVTDRLVVAVEIGAMNDVDRSLNEEIQLADDLAGYQQWICLVNQSWRSLMSGRVVESETFCSRALDVGIETGQPDAMVFYASQLFLIRDCQGRLDELIPAMEQAIAENPDIAGFRGALTKSYCETGRVDDAARMLAAEAASSFESVPRDVVWGTTLCLFGEVAARLGAPEPAAVLLERLRPHAHLVATDGAHVYQPIALTTARLGNLLGDPEADAWLRQAEDLARRAAAPIWTAEVLLTRAETASDPSVAEQVLSIVDRLGPTAVGARARALIGSA